MIEKMECEHKKCLELMMSEKESEEIRRLAIRSIFSIVEGMCYRMKLTAFLIGRLREMEFTRAEIAMINEEAYFINNGKAEIKPYFPNFIDNLRFSFKILSRVLGVDFSLNVGGSNFREFKEAIKIRNRITHPKGTKDLIISKDDLSKVTNAHDWFVANLRKLSKGITDLRIP